MRRLLRSTGRPCLAAAILAVALAPGVAAQVTPDPRDTLHAYGPGGPLPAMKEAAATFGQKRGINVEVTAGPTPQWIDHAKVDADMIFSGSEVMMSDFITAMPDIDTTSVQPLYLRPAVILVRPGNPTHINGLADLLKSGHRILVVNGAGQQGLWEDVAGRLGDIGTVRALRSNIVKVAGNSAQAKQAWTDDNSIDAWLIWSSWQVANANVADQVPLEPQYAIYRDTGIALTKTAQPAAKEFANFLASPEGAAIFEKWGWIIPKQ